MIYLEMSRDETHGGGTWAFPNCVWSPTRKENGSRWPFWENVLAIRTGDTILHLRGVRPRALFMGYSTASGDGFETNKRPPDPREWSFSKNFFRADLEGFIPFHRPINLEDVFKEKRAQLESYFDTNRTRGVDKKTIFYVRQSGQLQCQNGAYLSEVDATLFEILLGVPSQENELREEKNLISVETGWQIATIRSRLGQAAFSHSIKEQYGYACCFPGCNVRDSRFLVASHIARWSDNEHLRGNLGNGLCLCVMHDKAFEIGLFTLDEHYRVFINPRERNNSSEVVNALLNANGRTISLAKVRPLDEALLEHWIRVDISP